MNKTELIDAISEGANLPKAAAGRALDATLEAIMNGLQRDEQVGILGFGSFSVRTRQARMGRNPQTGEMIEIKETKIVSFKAGKLFKDKIKGHLEANKN